MKHSIQRDRKTKKRKKEKGVPLENRFNNSKTKANICKLCFRKILPTLKFLLGGSIQQENTQDIYVGGLTHLNAHREQQFINMARYRSMLNIFHVIGWEKDENTANLAINNKRYFPRLNNRYINNATFKMIHTTVFEYMQNDENIYPKFHLIFLDYCGNLGTNIEEDINIIFKKRMFATNTASWLFIMASFNHQKKEYLETLNPFKDRYARVSSRLMTHSGLTISDVKLKASGFSNKIIDLGMDNGFFKLLDDGITKIPTVEFSDCGAYASFNKKEKESGRGSPYTIMGWWLFRIN